MPGKWWVLAAGGAGEVVGAAVGHGAVGKVHLSGRPQKNKMDVLKGEEGKRVASGGRHFRPTRGERLCRVP